MELTLDRVENRLKAINSRVFLEKINGKYTFYCCGSQGVIQLTLNFSAGLKINEVSEFLSSISNLFA